jgi:PAS domain S-box-containing protein
VHGRPADAGELLDLSFRHGPVATALISPDGRWLRVNRRLCELLGRDEGTLLAGRLEDVTHPDDVHRDRWLGREILDGLRDRYAIDKRYVRADGHVVPARLEVSLVRDEDGAPRWFVFQVVDLEDVGPARRRLVAGASVA